MFLLCESDAEKPRDSKERLVWRIEFNVESDCSSLLGFCLSCEANLKLPESGRIEELNGLNCRSWEEMHTCLKESAFFSSSDSKAIVDGNLKLILGLVWTLILHYSISMPMWEGEDEEVTAGVKLKDRTMISHIEMIVDLFIFYFLFRQSQRHLNSVCWAGFNTKFLTCRSPTSARTGETGGRWELWWTAALQVQSVN